MDASTFAVARLTLRGTTGAGPAVRLRAANELEAADLTPAGLSPASVLVVRRLADPMPRRFGTQHRRPRPDWERAVRRALENAARVAARPDHRGHLDASATAVLFEDEAQLIACLVADRAHGRVASGWWWPSVLLRLDVPSGAAFGGGRDPGAILAARPREVPAVLSTIVRWQETHAVANALTIGSASLALRSIASTHGLSAATVVDWLQLAIDRAGVATAGSHPFQRDIITADSAAPWERWLPPAIMGSATAPEIQLLLGIACGLHAAPAQLRASTVALRGERAQSRQPHRDNRRRQSKTNHDAVAESAEGADRAELATAPNTPITAAAQTIEHTSSAIASDTQRAGAISMRRETAGGAMAHSDLIAPPMSEQARESRDRTEGEAAPPMADTERAIGTTLANADASDDRVSSASLLPTQANTASTVLEPAAVPAVTVPTRPSALATTGAITRLGGIFYLVHVLERLELPRAFGPAWAIDASAGSWGTLDLIARALLGSSWSARDRVWEALAELASWDDGSARPFRSQFVNGASDPAWVAPPGWPAELGDSLEEIAWSHAGSRVCLWLRGKYLLTHRPAVGDAETAARRAHRRYAPDATGMTRTTRLVRRPAGEIPWLPPALLPSGCPPRLGRWAAAATPAVLRRLRLALGSDTSAGEMLRAPARVYVTASHVDVVFALGDINLQVRRAGLDRNPGWLPAFGRVIYFHFQ